jgi:hypothetical protein
LDELAVAVEPGELTQDCVFELMAGESVAAAALGSYFWRLVQA